MRTEKKNETNTDQPEGDSGSGSDAKDAAKEKRDIAGPKG